ncbi:hypothetical protein KM908_14270 [Alkalihalobacillus clausii]|uniref:hypothetical protein n=1 Tax=Shouchella clausii TaxID=79880 RepID=UPI001C2379DA|nr:hypothetical protein [Shouchella clausii]MBU8597307.1 hypothetical protein [Shouchella clausii]
MAKTEPVVLTKEQAEAIQTLDRLPVGKDDVIKQKAMGRVWGRDLTCIDSLSLDELARALYVGYEVEKTQEERYEDVMGVYMDASDWDRSVIELTLDLLGIKIEGVND